MIKEVNIQFDSGVCYMGSTKSKFCTTEDSNIKIKKMSSKTKSLYYSLNDTLFVLNESINSSIQNKIKKRKYSYDTFLETK